MEKICIIATNNKFEAVYYEEDKLPLNYILKVPDVNTKQNKYFLTNTAITVVWQYSSWYGWILKVTYKDSELLRIADITKAQLAIDVLNKFNTISKSELEIMLQEVQVKEKTTLEIRIEELKTEKTKLDEQIKIYKAIQTKKEEIKDLLEKL